jgi:hypothetical protein
VERISHPDESVVGIEELNFSDNSTEVIGDKFILKNYFNTLNFEEFL